MLFLTWMGPEITSLTCRSTCDTFASLTFTSMWLIMCRNFIVNNSDWPQTRPGFKWICTQVHSVGTKSHNLILNRVLNIICIKYGTNYRLCLKNNVHVNANCSDEGDQEIVLDFKNKKLFSMLGILNIIVFMYFYELCLCMCVCERERLSIFPSFKQTRFQDYILSTFFN